MGREDQIQEGNLVSDASIQSNQTTAQVGGANGKRVKCQGADGTGRNLVRQQGLVEIVRDCP